MSQSIARCCAHLTAKQGARNFARRALLAAAGSAFLATTAFGQSQHSWTFAGSGLWGTSSNWLGGTPDGNDDVYFSAGGGSFEISSIPTYSGWRLTSQAGAGSFTLSGGTMSLFDFGNTSGTGPKIENLSSNLLTINNAVVLDSDADSGQAGEINPVNGDITLNSTLDLADSGNTQLRIFGNNGKTVTFNGIVSGPNSVAINQASNVVYAAGNTYTGDTFINAGTLQMAAGSSVASPFIRIGDTSGSVNATLALTSATGGQSISTPINVRASTGLKTIRSANTSGTNTLSGNIFLDGDVTVTAENAAATLTLSGTGSDLKARTLTVSGTGTTNITGNLQNPTTSDLGKLTKTGAGVLLLSGTNTYRGATTINGGTVVVSADNNLGTAPGTAGTTAATANIQFGGGSLRPTSNFTLGSMRTLGFLTGSGTIDVPTGVTLTVGGRLEGTTGYNKTGAGTLQLTNLSSGVTGAVSVTGGVLELTTSGRIGGTGAGSGNVTLDGATLRNNDPATGNSLLTANRNLLIGAGGATFDTPTSGVALIYSGTILGSGNTVTKIGAGEMRVQGTTLPNFTFSKLIVLNGLYRIGGTAGGTEVGFGAVPASFDASAITLNGGAIGTSLNLSLHPNRGITLGVNGGTWNSGTSAGTISGSVTGAGGLTKVAGSGTLRFLSTSDFTGAFTLLGDRVEVWADNALGTGSLIFNATGVGTLVNNNTPSADITLGNATVQFSSGTTIDIAANSGRSLTLTGKLTGPTAWKRDNGGTGTVVLTNSTNDFSGALTITVGQLAITANNTLGGTAGNTTVGASASLVMRGGFTYTTAEPVSIGGTGSTASTGAINSASGTNSFAGPITMTTASRINVAADRLTLSGGITDGASTLALEKTGNGTLRLTGASTYDGATTVAAGTLLASNTTGSAVGTGAVNVSSGAVLGGTGTFTGAANINAGASLAPGESIGDLDTGPLTFADGTSKYLIELDADTPASDRTNVTGAVTLNGATLQLSFAAITPDTHGNPQTFVIINKVDAGAVSGNFAANIVAPSFVQVVVNYAYSGTDSTLFNADGNDVAITVTYVPEPALGVPVLAGLALCRRRRRA